MALVNFAESLPVLTNFAAAPIAVTGGSRKPYALMPATLFSSAGAAVVYGVNKRSKRSAYFGRVIGDGVATTVTDATVAALAEVGATEAVRTTCDPAQYLTIVCTVSGTPLTRVAANASPSTGEFKIDEDGGDYTVTFGTAPASGAVVDFHVNAPAGAEANKITLTQHAADDSAVVYDFMGTATAIATIMN